MVLMDCGFVEVMVLVTVKSERVAPLQLVLAVNCVRITLILSVVEYNTDDPVPVGIHAPTGTYEIEVAVSRLAHDESLYVAEITTNPLLVVCPYCVPTALTLEKIPQRTTSPKNGMYDIMMYQIVVQFQRM